MKPMARSAALIGGVDYRRLGVQPAVTPRPIAQPGLGVSSLCFSGGAGLERGAFALGKRRDDEAVDIGG